MITISRSLLRSLRDPQRPLCAQCHRCLAQSAPLQSGHSRWSKIKHDKAVTDSRKGKALAVLAKEIEDASRQGGPEPTLNPRLVQAITNAKRGGYAKANIEAAIARGQGRSASGAALESMTIEAVVPPVALIVDCSTDSKARVLQDLRVMLKKYGARETPTAYLFEKRGRSIFAAKDEVGADEVLEVALEAGVIDVEQDEDGRIIVDTGVTDTKTAEQLIVDSLKLDINSSETVWHPNADTQVEDVEEATYTTLSKLEEELEDYDDVTGVFHNLVPTDSPPAPGPAIDYS